MELIPEKQNETDRKRAANTWILAAFQGAFSNF